MQVGFYSTNAYANARHTQGYPVHGGAEARNIAPRQEDDSQATVVTLSEAARSAASVPDFSQVLAAARETLNQLLAEAERASPLENDKLALDMTRLGERELYAITVNDDGLFTSDERKAAEIEMQRRFDSAMTGPIAISELTADYRPLYRAAATWLDALGPEQKASPQWKDARAAIDTALARLAGEKGTSPAGIANDPVAAWLEKRATTEKEAATDPVSLEEGLRAALDKQYEKARQEGRIPTFDASNTRGAYIDLGIFDAETVSAIVHNRNGLFSGEEVRAATAEIRNRANVALSEGYRDAAKSSDPTAFARNIISIYSSLTPEVRQAAGFSENMLSTAMSSFETTSRLLEMMATNTQGGGAGWFAGR